MRIAHLIQVMVSWILLFDVNRVACIIDEFYWLVRYSAVMGLSQVCRICKTQTIKDGFSRAAWDTLVQRHSTEPNEKVLEAYKISNV